MKRYILPILIVVICAAAIVVDNIYCAATKPKPEVIKPEPEVITETIYVEVPVKETVVETVFSHDVHYVEVPISAEYSADDLYCLAAVIYQEAGGNACCDECRKNVGDVVLNRVADERFPDTIREVLEAPGQYGAFSQTGVVWPDRANFAIERDAVVRAWHTAAKLLGGEHGALYGNGYIWQAEFEQGSGGYWCCGTYYGR